jgi:hypothetical protein
MLSYLRCIKSHRGSNDSECRGLSKSYLSCRMDRYVHRPLLLLIRAPLPCHKYPKLLLQGARKGGEASCDTDMSECFGPGIRKDSNGSKGSRLQRFCTSHSSHLSRSETLPLSNRQSSSPLCCTARAEIVYHLHMLPSHRLGSIRTGRIAAQNRTRVRILADRFCACRNLMAPDSFKNLGFGDHSDGPDAAAATSTEPSQPQGQDKPRGA